MARYDDALFKASEAGRHAQDIAYFNARAEDFGERAIEAFKQYNAANARYLELVALGVPPAMLGGVVEGIRGWLNTYHKYERLCSDAAIKARYC